MSDPSLAQTETVEKPIIHEPPLERTTDAQAKVIKLELRSPVLGLTVPLPNPFCGIGRKSPLTNIDRVIQEGQVYQVTAGIYSQFQPANHLKFSLSSLISVYSVCLHYMYYYSPTLKRGLFRIWVVCPSIRSSVIIFFVSTQYIQNSFKEFNKIVNVH